MFFTICLIAALLLPAVAGRQQSEAPAQPLLEYAGEPLRFPFECSNDDIASFAMVCSAAAPCPVYLELSSVEPAGGKLFLVGNLHSHAATMYSVLLVSEDGGLSWSEPYERLRAAALDRVFFFDANSGWVSGHVLDPRPRDPFFLLTTDGGKNWRRRPVFSDGAMGLIERFWFDSEQTGGLLIDRLHPNEAGARYERYETMTGAESWMIREVSAAPIRIRNVLVSSSDPNLDWHLTPDRESDAWRIEHSDGGQWSTVCEFRIEVGHCVPRREVLAEKPPEAAPQPREQPVAPGGVFRIPGPGTAPAPPEKKPQPKKPPALDKPGP